MPWGLYVLKKIFQRFQVHHVQTVGSLAVIFSVSLPHSLLFRYPCEIDRLFARSSNGAGKRTQSSAGDAGRAEMLLGKETSERQEIFPTLTVSAHDLGAIVN